MTRIAVTSRSFSRHPVLRQELLDCHENVTFNDSGRSLKDAELIEFLQSHDKAIVALEIIDDKIFAKLPQLNVISKYGVGFDSLDIGAMSSPSPLHFCDTFQNSTVMFEAACGSNNRA
jgi:phosphoglycerate dehydrogenase-like enzyme